MVHGKNHISYWIDRRLTGLTGPDYAAPISFGLPFEPEDSQYGKYWLNRSSGRVARLYKTGRRICGSGTGCEREEHGQAIGDGNGQRALGE